MHAGLIAAVPEIDLQRFESPAIDGGKVERIHQGQRGVHRIPFFSVG
jgi:hypothetical protein